jgi:uncharacterized protein DUF3303
MIRKESPMLFHTTWDFVDPTEDSERRHVALFAQWQPPAEMDFQAFYINADYSGGMAIADVDSAETLVRCVAPWLPYLRFKTTPIVPVEVSMDIRSEAIAFRDSVSSTAAEDAALIGG